MVAARWAASIGRVVCLIGLAATPVASASAPLDRPDAEYAIRWSPADGGPSDLRAVTGLLRIDGRTSEYDVVYRDVARPDDAPPGFVPIVRQRRRGARTDVTWKYRGRDGFPVQSAAAWRCPLRGEASRKDEVDVSVLAADTESRSYSRSCSADGDLAASAPGAPAPLADGCSSRVTRLRARDGALTVEEWRTSSGATFVEVSARGDDAAADLRNFRHTVAQPLLDAGIRPLDRSKTEIASPCRPAPTGP